MHDTKVCDGASTSGVLVKASSL